MKKVQPSVLVLASKHVGLESLRFLIKHKTPIIKVIAARHDDKDIVALAKKAGLSVEVFGPRTQEGLVASGKHYNWLLNLWSPHILRDEVLALADARLNCHSSFVPHCQGNDNAAWAIRKNLPAGVSLLEMTTRVDTGGVYAQKRVAYAFPMNGKALHTVLQEEMINLFKNSWPDIFQGKVRAKPQKGPVTWHKRSQTEADRVKKSDEVLSLGEMMTWSLAHDFSPGTTAEVIYGKKKYKMRCLIEEIKTIP